MDGTVSITGVGWLEAMFLLTGVMVLVLGFFWRQFRQESRQNAEEHTKILEVLQSMKDSHTEHASQLREFANILRTLKDWYESYRAEPLSTGENLHAWLEAYEKFKDHMYRDQAELRQLITDVRTDLELAKKELGQVHTICRMRHPDVVPATASTGNRQGNT